MLMNVLCFNRKKAVRTNYNDKSIKEVRQENMRFLDLFAGIGGFRLGMEALGHECVGFVECDPYCEKCKKITKHVFSGERNFTICTECGKKKRQHARFSYDAIHDPGEEWTAYDIRDVTDNDLGLLRGKGIDVICGGFPCQAFSVAGKRGGFDDTRGTLFFEIARFAQQIKPRFLFLENVKGLLSHDQGNTFGTILNTLDELGYDTEWQVLNSKNYVPQNRERVFLVGHLRGSSGREVFPIGETIAKDDYKQPKQIAIIRELGKLNPKRHSSLANSVLSTEGLSPSLDTMQGGNREPKILDFRQAKREGKPRVYTDNAPALTARDYKGPQCIDDSYRIRKLTPKECWRLQGFPDWAFDKAKEVNSDSQLYKQAGNSVSVPVIYEIAKRLGVE
jgi:DNA (cytosine-5)-methyltransferase 1